MGDKEDPGNYRGITLLSVVGKVFCKIVNDRHLESGGVYMKVRQVLEQRGGV